MSRFSYAHPIRAPEDIRPFLADPELHWRKGYSAAELAIAWISRRDIPPEVRAVLDQSEDWRNGRLIEAMFEREVDLRTPGRASHTDLMVYCSLASGMGVIAVEGKVREPFGQLVADWNNSPGKARRLSHLGELLGIPVPEQPQLRWQLFHRAASAVFEAERWGARQAVMLVHSFCDEDSSLGDFAKFAQAAGFTGAGRGAISEPRQIGNVSLRLGWAADVLSP